MTAKPSKEPTVIDEAFMERFENESLAYRAWTGVDLAQEILFDDKSCADSLSDAKFEVAHACMALRVLVRRLTGMDVETLRKAVLKRHIEVFVLDETIDTVPDGETLQ